MIYPAALTLALLFSQPVRALPQGSPAGAPWSPSASTYTPTTSPYSTKYPPSTTPYSTSYPPTTTPYSPTTTPYSSTSTPYSSTTDSYSSTSTPYSPTTTPYSPTTTPYSPTTTPYSPTTTPYYPTNTPSSTYYPPTTTPYPSSYSPTYTQSKPSCTCYPTPTPYSSSSPYEDSDEDDDDTYPPGDCPCYSSTPYSSTQPPYTSSVYPPEQTTAYPPKTTPYSPAQPGTPTPTPLRATFDTTFDNKAGSLNGVACSNGPNGLASRFPTFGDIPSFPFIGGVFDVAWNSPNCGACWAVTNPATGTTINITAVDTAGAGFNLAKEAFDKLAGGQSGLGAVDVVANKVSPSDCGL